MTDFGLKVRMVVVGAILFGFYLVTATFVAAMTGFNLWIILAAGLLIVPPIQYKIGKWMALRGAEDMPETGQYQRVHHMTDQLARDMGLSNVRLMKQQMGVPNAFAVGRKGAGVVVVSDELMAILEEDELEGVVAHELAHIKNRDVITMVVGQSIGMLFGYVAYIAVLFGGERNMGSFILAMVASQIANMLVMIFVMAISRYREYAADEDAREAIGSGDPLARALQKISAGAEGREQQTNDTVAALCIFNADRSLLQQIFSTHPPTEKRIEKLRA